MNFGIILDVETTGLDCNKDKIIEIGILKIALNNNYQAKLVSLYSQLEDPNEIIPDTIENITGITNFILKNQKIDWNKIREDLTNSSFVIAHNMPFDRSFIEKIEILKDLKIHWACSQKHIDWQKHGFKSRALNYLACDHGFINPFPHRALFDCATTFKLISPYIKELLEKSHEHEYELIANNAPFSLKDKLKENGYIWNSSKKVWFKNVFQSNLDEERNFLKKNIYNGLALFEENKIK